MPINGGDKEAHHVHFISNEKNNFSKTKIYFHQKKTTPQSLGHVGLQNMKVGEKTNFGDLPLFV